MRLVLFAAAACLVLATACNNNPSSNQGDRATVVGVVQGVQANTRLFFYDQNLNQLGSISVQVRQDGTYGPLSFENGTFFGAGTASGFTTGKFVRFDVHSADDSLNVDFQLGPVSVPLAVGNRWTYDEFHGDEASPSRTVVVEITASQPAEEAPAVFTVEERSTDLASGVTDTTTYFLAQTGGGIRKSADTTVTETDELLLRLPATLGSTWNTTDFATGAALQKRLKALSCDASGCVETNDFTIAQEPAGTFMSVSEIHNSDTQAFVTVFSSIGVVDSLVLDIPSGARQVQRKLTRFESPVGGST